MARIRYTGDGTLRMHGHDYDDLEAGDEERVTAEVADELCERADVERVNTD